MATRISSSLIDEMTHEVLQQIEPSSKSSSGSEQILPAPQARQQPPVLTPLEILRASIISYGDLVSPIEEDGWEPSP